MDSNPHTNEGRLEDLVGRIKEAAGVLFGNRDMKREGQADQWTGQAKSTASDAIDEVRESVEKLADSIGSDDSDDEGESPSTTHRSTPRQ